VNPFTGRVPREPSAAPAHDWNERIDAECYRPNAYARVRDSHGRIVRIVNNYERLSFNVGPSLFRWLEAEAPATYARLIQADRTARTAIAHPFHHVILPLANRRDRRTEILWGLADFRHRFGREPDGIWMPETAVDTATLLDLADLGVRATIVGGHQIVGGARTGRYSWRPEPGRDRSVELFVYDGPVSHAIAFGGALRSADDLVGRLVAASDLGLAVAATDGETFGHHHMFTERAVAHGLFQVAPSRGVRPVGITSALELVHSRGDVEVLPSAWSCAHGLGRWREDCGCVTGGSAGWTQHWRSPLRLALDHLRDELARVTDTVGARHFEDPWAARDDYARVLMDQKATDAFLARHLRPRAPAHVALALMQAHVHALAMYTSCGWFFADAAGLETIIVLRHADRCMERMLAAGVAPPTASFLELLSRVHSNDPAEGDGRAIWERRVLPAREDDFDGRARAADPVSVRFDDLVERALGGSTEAAEEALATLAGSRRDGRLLDTTRSEEMLFEALALGRRANGLRPLAEALGMAVDELGVLH
jgi:hypothetical protein